MAIVYSILTLKGGVGKSTITYNLAHGLRLHGKKVLIIDMDSQGDVSWITKANTELTTYDVIMGNCTIDKAIQELDGISIIPADSNLSKLDSELKGDEKESALFNSLIPVATNFDVILIDNTPKTSITSILALMCTDKVIIPVVPHGLSLKACTSTIELIELLQEYNEDLQVGGFIFNMWISRPLLSSDVNEVLNNIAQKNNIKIYDTKIRNSISVAESMGLHTNIFDYANKSNNGYIDYTNFLEEILKEIN